jgi:hypothetical protein
VPISDLPDGRWYFHLQVRDGWGNWSPVASRAVGVDTTPPVTGTNADSAWHRAYGLVLTPSDALSGPAVTRYRVNNGAWTQGTAVELPVPRHKRHWDGPLRVSFYSVDQAGNAETPAEVAVLIDVSAPLTRDDAPPGPVLSPHTVHLTPWDRFSGVVFTYYSLDGGRWKRGTEVEVKGTGGHTIQYRSEDVAGNVETVRSCTVTLIAEGLGARSHVFRGR